MDFPSSLTMKTQDLTMTYKTAHNWAPSCFPLTPSALLSAFLMGCSRTGLPTILPACQAPSYLRAFAQLLPVWNILSPDTLNTYSLTSNAHLYVTFSVNPCLTYFKTGLIHPLPTSSNPLLWHRGYLEQCLAITKNSINIQWWIKETLFYR